MNSDIAGDQDNRLIGFAEGTAPGPTVVVLAGMHGNEPSGVAALQNIFEMIQTAEVSFKGRFVGLRGNIPALKQKVRFVDEDMNRIWFPSIIEQVRETPMGELESSERREIKQVLEVLDHIGSEDEEPFIFADLHSFSAEGCMFTITAHKERHLNLLSNLHVPMIFGIENSLRGTALRYFQDMGHITFALEGGQHQNDLTVYNIVAALFLLLNETGFLNGKAFPIITEFDRHLKSYTSKVPGQVELVYQHIIEEGDDFSMRPGYKNFQPIKKGEWLASDREGRIEALCDGYLLMPLYQNQGNDGFFIVREHA